MKLILRSGRGYCTRVRFRGRALVKVSGDIGFYSWIVVGQVSWQKCSSLIYSLRKKFSKNY